MRPRHPWYRAQTNSWYVEIAGEQKYLGKHPEGSPVPRKRKRGESPPRPPAEIEGAWHRLMASGAGKVPDTSELHVATICDLFLDFSQKHHTEKTYRGYRDFLQDFCEHCGTLLGEQLKPLHVTHWLDAHPGWKGGQRNAVIAVKRVFNWAETEGLLSPNPIKAVRKPPQKKRERILTPQEREEILNAIPDEGFHDLVFAMMETGARPGEARTVTAENVNLELGVWVFAEHKTAKRTGRSRIIYLTPAMVELSRKLVEKYPEGPLFRGPLSKKGFTQNGIRCRFRTLRKKLPHLEGVISYTMRHSFATQALVNGVGIAQVAELLGHVDTTMVSQHYSHLAGNVQHMREAARQAAQGQDA